MAADATRPTLEYLNVALTSEVYNKLRAMARALTQGEQSASLVNKVLVELANKPEIAAGEVGLVQVAFWKMMDVIRNERRSRLRLKRGGDAIFRSVSDADVAVVDRHASDAISKVECEDLLENLTRIRKSNDYAAVLMLVAQGFTNPEVAEVLGVSLSTMKMNYLKPARAFMRERIANMDHSSSARKAGIPL